jgi:hypothetical protein
METLQVTNSSLFANKFDQIPLKIRTVPTTVIILVTSKLVVFFIINILTFMTVMASGWEFSANNKFHHTVSSQFVNTMSMERNLRENAQITNSIYCNESDK